MSRVMEWYVWWLMWVGEGGGETRPRTEQRHGGAGNGEQEDEERDLMERRDYESRRLEGWTLEKHNEQRGGCLGRVRRRRWNNSPCGRSKLLSQSHIQYASIEH
ncbi:hypothetical protein NEUTE1DRAFT_117774 [Neurospora tetrasperma FGSC 2508]|uniref:Uncharacterized protein n=1 Tax=Neurospora tetrasperma (strain FGSC 2508 / ATCC MYA-4615 / P0657) TaxID=510951 RepID=F8MTW2_NEUT8|nr:uncharacterized protein NEUTE1DRAFT_117774 [Neurospora tetrasperma FGSC 2508]EGO55444.1 hypothetical protein NEUTE1DRAFT_117774 [Neurospora tetrasperma FGSC 2508]EGZ69327.1 hypothetical protein NEUTE2DRAFT_145516 [Neurospora tetrasperma FGSC 2509]